MRALLRLLVGVYLALGMGCALTVDKATWNIILPEQQTIDSRDPSRLPPANLPAQPPPRTVSNPRDEAPEWRMTLDEASRLASENARVVRVLAGISAVSSGQTIYEPAIRNTLIDQEQARFDPTLAWSNRWTRTEVPQAIFDPLNLGRSLLVGSETDDYRSVVGLEKTNLLGGQWALNWTENPTRFGPNITPLDPQNRSALEVSYTQPLLQGGGFAVNTAPIVIARLNTEISYFQYKDSVQELVRGVIEAYWNLVQARIDLWARKIQVQQSEQALQREEARLGTGFGNRGQVAQAKATYHQFRSGQVAAAAAILSREGALRNILGLPPTDDRQIVPVSAPANERLRPDWDGLVRLSEQRRPDIIELKIILEADQVRLLQARNQALPRIDASALYRWNGLSGEMPNGDRLSTGTGEFTDWSLGINFSVPLGLRQGRALVRQQELLISRDQANLQQGIHAVIHELANTVRELDSAYEQYLVLKETRAAAFENLQAQVADFQTRGNIYLNVLQALDAWGNAVSSEAASLLSYNVALATLERQTGTILETHGLVFAEERFRAAGPFNILCGERMYPSSVVPRGSPERYPGSGDSSEKSFDLRNPDARAGKPEEKPAEKKPEAKP